ncbi:MarR family winged helix-turn-helix transcriptional regulator [Actinopolymorpha pittospori]|uniref:DNA-binding MarR family transcriptional regulator n=1 Tax=Actinopolymorpha pittospori TaxID=648752 RepID=A0A927RGE7_9ACTN|nr:MarR family transcriptional regulator [Actinopolymorpha pittospori]MBE1604156.1 DNA-binding MarR family transcriptional regulator [Actinopolymorpha pittospori]
MLADVTVSRSAGAEIGLLLRLAHQRAAKAFTEALQALDIEGRHYGVLTTLARLGPVTQARLTQELNSDKSAMLRTVDELEQRGLTVRQPVPGDRRARTIALTAEGEKRFAAANKVAEQVTQQLFGCLTKAEQATFRDLLTRFVRNGSEGSGPS